MELWDWRDVEEQTSVPSCSKHGELLMKLSGRGVMKLCETGGASAADMGVPVSKMEESIEACIQASLKTAQDPDGAVPSVS